MAPQPKYLPFPGYIVFQSLLFCNVVCCIQILCIHQNTSTHFQKLPYFAQSNPLIFVTKISIAKYNEFPLDIANGARKPLLFITVVAFPFWLATVCPFAEHAAGAQGGDDPHDCPPHQHHPGPGLFLWLFPPGNQSAFFQATYPCPI